MTETNPLGSIARRVSKIKDLEKSAGLRDLFAISQAGTPCLRCGRVLHERDKGGPAMPRTPDTAWLTQGSCQWRNLGTAAVEGFVSRSKAPGVEKRRNGLRSWEGSNVGASSRLRWGKVIQFSC